MQKNRRYRMIIKNQKNFLNKIIPRSQQNSLFLQCAEKHSELIKLPNIN